MPFGFTLPDGVVEVMTGTVARFTRTIKVKANAIHFAADMDLDSYASNELSISHCHIARRRYQPFPDPCKIALASSFLLSTGPSIPPASTVPSLSLINRSYSRSTSRLRTYRLIRSRRSAPYSLASCRASASASEALSKEQHQLE